MNEVEDANAASIVRLSRMKRGIEKLRLERAFLLEQLAKRTSTNVEDSEGSPSPPPTVRPEHPQYLYHSDSNRRALTLSSPKKNHSVPSVVTANLPSSPTSTPQPVETHPSSKEIKP
jgi:hypothetical protein